MSVKELIGDQQLTRTADGYAVTRVFLVEVGQAEVDQAKMLKAMQTDGVPQYGDPHPHVPEVIVTRVTAGTNTMTGKQQMRVQCDYTVPDADDDSETDIEAEAEGSVSLTTSLATEQTYFDINGDFLTVQWKGAAFVTVYKNADVQRPEIEVAFRRIENSIPKAVIANYLGKVNSATWSGFPPKTWLCTRIDAREEKEGKFNVDYGFSYKPETWRLEVIANLTAEQINELPPNTETANGYQLYDVYHSIDFNNLGLTF